MRALLLGLAIALSACATSASQTAPINAARSAANASTTAPAPDERDAIWLAFSGGGARAASFSLGALQGLRDMRAADGGSLLDHVRLITAVSGGSITAGYYGLHGKDGLDTFRAAYLDKNWIGEIHTHAASPLNWVRAYRGGLNNQALLADWLDREVFAGAHMGDMHTQVILNATDLYNGTTFAFTPPFFDAICSDLSAVRVADAVAASMAVPVAFKPILVEPHPDRCAPLPAWVQAQNDHAQPALVRRTAQSFAAYRDPARQPYLHLVDGGVIDNLGLTTLALMRETARAPYEPLSEAQAVKLRRLTILVVNAEKIADPTWQLSPNGPNGADVGDRLFDIIIEAPNRASYDTFRLIAAQWERDLRAYRCALTPDAVARLRGNTTGWACDDIHIAVDMLSFMDFDEARRVQFGSAATAVTLPPDLTTALIAGGRDGIMHNAAALALTR